MQNSPAEIISLTIGITTIFLFIVGAFSVRYIFLYQKKGFRHREEVADMREVFKQTLLQSKLEIQEQTLDHVAKELHATVGQLVSLIQIELEELAIHASGKIKENTFEMQVLIQQLFAELKSLNGSLNTDHIMHIGFLQALTNELTRLENTDKFHTNFSKAGEEFRLRPEHEIILFRLCQEVLNNIVKHAHAKVISILINYSNSEFILEIADDGKGFNIEKALEQSGETVSTGLINIQKRATLINGLVTIKSNPGHGTKFIIHISKEVN
jgi:signal transduction histidine kinase